MASTHKTVTVFSKDYLSLETFKCYKKVKLKSGK